MRSTCARFFVVALLVASVAVVDPFPAGAAGKWTVVPSASPSGPPSAAFSSIACPSATSCVAVGYAYGTTSSLLAEHWNGASWSIESIPDIGYGTFHDVACPTTTFCMALVSSADGPATARWDGTSWSIVPVPDTGEYSAIFSLACSSPTNCFAVGAQGTVLTSATLIERWNGTKWSVVPSPSVTGSTLNQLFGVTCTSDTNCFAVGGATNGVNRTLVERWDGTKWSIVPSSTPAEAGLPTLRSVSCWRPDACFAVGEYDASEDYQKTLTERWDGTTWSIVASPNVAGVNGQSLSDVSCSGDTSCFATRATSKRFDPWHGSIVHWNGTKWSDSESPPLTTAGSGLNGVACMSDASCFVVGNAGSPRPRGIMEYWNGTAWSRAEHPLDPAPPDSRLVSVSCVTAATCFGVGHYTNSANQVVTLIERPSGNSWAVVAGPNKLGARESRLSGVSCPSAGLCFAVGTYINAQRRAQTLIERWNGSTWSIIASPNHPGSANSGTNSLSAVSCSSPKNCFAVGTYDNGTLKTLIMRWDGTKWAIVPSPNRARIGTNLLEGVSCPTATSCFAVGRSSTDGPGTYRTLTERWNGRTWAIVPSPTVKDAAVSDLVSVSCASPTMCVAVGSARSTTSVKSLVERWNGKTWTRVAGTDPAGATNTDLSGVSCASATSCRAVGGRSGSSGLYQTLVTTFAGAKWSSSSAATPAGARNNFLRSVSCPSAAACYTVGEFDTVGAPQTLVERYS